MKTKRLISRAKFSEEAGVSRAAVTKACAGALKDAVDGKSIDIDHPSAVAYIKSKRTKKTPPPAKKAKRKAAAKRKASGVPPPPSEPDDEPHYSRDAELQHVLHLTIGELLKQFGTEGQFKAWLDAKKTIAETKIKELKVAEAEGALIPREVVKVHIFGAMEASNLRILTDTPKTLTRRLYSLAKSGAPMEEGEALARKLLADQLKNVATTARRILK